MKRWVVISVVLLAATGIAVRLADSGRTINQRFERIANGASRDQVVRLLGPPGKFAKPKNSMMMTMAGLGPRKDYDEDLSWLVEENGEYVWIIVQFKNGRVVEAYIHHEPCE